MLSLPSFLLSYSPAPPAFVLSPQGSSDCMVSASFSVENTISLGSPASRIGGGSPDLDY